MLNIEVRNHKVDKISFGGNYDEITTDLGLIIDTVLLELSETREDEEEILDNLISKIKEVWKIIDEGEQDELASRIKGVWKEVDKSDDKNSN
jgi:hypothetical protein